jgi:hypothetical protein
MSEKRKPEMVLFAEVLGKPGVKPTRFKVELFHVSQWLNPKGRGISWQPRSIRMLHADVYRLRVNGKWYPPSDAEPLTLSQVFALFRRSVSAVRSRKRDEPSARKAASQ